MEYNLYNAKGKTNNSLRFSKPKRVLALSLAGIITIYSGSAILSKRLDDRILPKEENLFSILTEDNRYKNTNNNKNGKVKTLNFNKINIYKVL